jgi:hypothetical protein
MPERGDGCCFVSRGLGTVLGGIVGIGLAVRLVFGAAFYLVSITTTSVPGQNGDSRPRSFHPNLDNSVP